MSAPATPRPAATLVLMRDAAHTFEVLLLRRSAGTRFVPGAYVFPGGLLDPEDAAPDALETIEGVTAERAAAQLDLRGANPPALAYYVAAAREAFEETGIVVGSNERAVDRIRRDLLDRRISFPDALRQVGCRIAAHEIAYFAHWITPERAPRRYDTRFFAARVPRDTLAVIDEREMTEALWIEPAEALRQYRVGTLPMILPTVHTIERLAAFSDTRSALAALAEAPVETILPGPEAGGFAGPAPQRRLPTS